MMQQGSTSILAAEAPSESGFYMIYCRQSAELQKTLIETIIINSGFNNNTNY